MTETVRPCAVILTYNEGVRIETAVKISRSWAEKVVVIDKSSTDNTVQLALHNGAEVISVPYSDQGHERPSEYHDLIAKRVHPAKWILGLTPGEIPERQLIDMVTVTVNSGLLNAADVVLMPIKIYSFGHHVPDGPFGDSVAFQPRLYNVDRVSYADEMHNALKLTKSSVKFPSDFGWIHHPTHRTLQSFLASHNHYVTGNQRRPGQELEYAELEIQRAHMFDHLMTTLTKSETRQIVAWKAYRLLLALKHLDEKYGPDTERSLDRRLSDLREQNWQL